MIRRLLLAGLLSYLAAGCRQAPQAEPNVGMPAGDSAAREVPPHYRFLSEPGIGMESVDSLWSQIPYDSIYLRREPCFGTCPMYDATLYRGGRARYRGIRFVDRVGDYRGEVTLQDYGRLAYLLDRFEFMSLPDSFAAAYTDLPGATLTVHRRPNGGLPPVAV